MNLPTYFASAAFDRLSWPPMSDGQQIAEIDVEELAERLAAGGVALFDVREPNEYDEVRVPGGRLIPLGTVPDRLEEIVAAAQDAEVVVICRSGGRSMRACEYLAAQGVAATNVYGGTLAWIQSGRDTESGASLG
jgi:rhodanese-related sulfurtransferase